MRFNGEWHKSDDGEVRPVITAKVIDARGEPWRARFLIDTGADTSLLCYGLFTSLGYTPNPPPHATSGLGGTVATGLVAANLYLKRDDGVEIPVKGPFIASVEHDGLGMSILGRDVLSHFAIIIDEPGKTVCLLAPRHTYVIHELR